MPGAGCGGATDVSSSARTKKQRVGAEHQELEYASSCCIPSTWKEYILIGVTPYNHDCSIFEFGLEPGQSLNLPVCACVLLEAPGGNVRPYTPISEAAGRFSLLVKRYERGAASSWLDSLPLGARVPFKHISANVKEQYPFEGRGTLSTV